MINIQSCKSGINHQKSPIDSLPRIFKLPSRSNDSIFQDRTPEHFTAHITIPDHTSPNSTSSRINPINLQDTRTADIFRRQLPNFASCGCSADLQSEAVRDKSWTRYPCDCVLCVCGWWIYWIPRSCFRYFPVMLFHCVTGRKVLQSHGHGPNYVNVCWSFEIFWVWCFSPRFSAVSQCWRPWGSKGLVWCNWRRLCRTVRNFREVNYGELWWNWKKMEDSKLERWLWKSLEWNFACLAGFWLYTSQEADQDLGMRLKKSEMVALFGACHALRQLGRCQLGRRQLGRCQLGQHELGRRHQSGEFWVVGQRYLTSLSWTKKLETFVEAEATGGGRWGTT